MPKDKENTHFTALWVDPADIIRPAYNMDATINSMEIYNSDIEPEFKEWFDSNILSSYYNEDKYPWTRLGYTYDWADNGEEYGLTEFLIKDKSNVTVEFTMTTDEFLQHILN